MAWFGGEGPPLREPTLQEMLGAFMQVITQANMDANARGDINARNTNEMMQFMANQNAQMSSQMAHGFQSMSANPNQGSGGSSDAASHGYRALKPKKDMTKITADDARKLMNEISCFEVDLNELGIAKFSEAAYRQLRAMADGRAKDVVDIETVQGRGKELLDQLTWATNNHQHQHNRDDIGGKLYNFLVGRLEDSVRLNQTKRLTIAEEIYAEARMYEDTPKEAELFLSRWRRSRYMMHKEGLVNQDRENLVARLSGQGLDAESIQEVNHSLEINERREMHVFLHQRVSKSVYEFIMSQSEKEQARNIDDCICLIQKYCEVKARVLDKEKVSIKVLEGNQTVVSFDGVPYAIDDPRISGMFQHLTEDVASEYADDMEDERWYYDASINAFSRGGNASYGGTRGGGKGPKGPGKERENPLPKGPPPGAVRCPTCHGYHEDLQTCPNGVAQQDPIYRPTAGAKCSHLVNGHKCDGQGHYTRHHRQQWMSENPGSVAPWAGKNSKGKGKGKRGRYNGKGISKRILVLEDGTCLNDGDIDPSLLEGYEEDYDDSYDAGDWEEPQVCSSCSPGVPPAAPAGVSPLSGAQPDGLPQTSSLTVGQQRAAQWSSSGVAGGPAAVKDPTCGSLKMSDEAIPSCSRLVRGEVENCPFDAMGATKLESRPYSSIPCDYQECPEGYDTRGFVASEKYQSTQGGALSPSGDTNVTVDPYALPLMLPKGVDSEGILLDQCNAKAQSLGHYVSSLKDRPASALLDTIRARSDRSCDPNEVLFNNSNPPSVVSLSDTIITPTDIQGLDENFVSSVSLVDHNYSVLGDKYQINSSRNFIVQALARSCSSLGVVSGADCASVALSGDPPAFRCGMSGHDGSGDEEAMGAGTPAAKVRPKAKLSTQSKARPSRSPPVKQQIPSHRVPAYAKGVTPSHPSGRLPERSAGPPRSKSLPVPKHTHDSVSRRNALALGARSEELKRRLTQNRIQHSRGSSSSALFQATVRGTPGVSMEQGTPTIEQCRLDTEAALDRVGEDFVRVSQIDGGKTIPSPVQLPRAVLWVAGENQVTPEFLQGCSDGVLVITAKKQVPDFVRRACEAAGVDPPLAFTVSHVPTHDLYIWEVLQRIFSALNSGRDVVIHCVAGKHRAASLALVVLMFGYRLRLTEAHDFLRARRPVIDLPGLFRHSGVDPETGRSFRSGGRDHFLVEYDALVDSWSNHPQESWFQANCQLYAAERDERSLQAPRVQRYCSTSGTGYRDVAMHSPGNMSPEGTAVSASEEDLELRQMMDEAVAPADLADRLVVGEEPYVDPESQRYVSCDHCGAYKGVFIKCFACYRWIHVSCRPRGETCCFGCYDKKRERDETAKGERAKRFASKRPSFLIQCAPARSRSAKRRKVSCPPAVRESWMPTGVEEPDLVSEEVEPLFRPRASILSTWLVPGSEMSPGAEERVNNMLSEEYDEWRVSEAHRIGKLLTQALVADRSRRHLTHPRDTCYMEISELAKRVVWGQGGGPLQAYGSLESFVRATLRSVKVLHLPSGGPLIRLMDDQEANFVELEGPVSAGEHSDSRVTTESVAPSPRRRRALPATPSTIETLRGRHPGPSIVRQPVIRVAISSPRTRRLVLVGVTGSYAIGKSTLAKDLSERFSSPLGEIQADFLHASATALPRGLTDTYGSTHHHVHAEGFALARTLAFRYRLVENFIADDFCPRHFRLGCNGERLHQRFVGVTLDSARPVIVFVTGSGLLLNDDFAACFDIVVMLDADEDIVLGRRLEQLARGHVSASDRDQVSAKHRQVDWPHRDRPARAAEHRYVRRHGNHAVVIPADKLNSQLEVAHGAEEAIQEKLRLLLRLPSKEALLELLDRPTIVPASQERSRVGTPHEAFVLGVPPEVPTAGDGARGSQDEDQERSQVACRAFTAYMRSVLDCDKYIAAAVDDEDELEQRSAEVDDAIEAPESIAERILRRRMRSKGEEMRRLQERTLRFDASERADEEIRAARDGSLPLQPGVYISWHARNSPATLRRTRVSRERLGVPSSSLSGGVTRSSHGGAKKGRFARWVSRRHQESRVQVGRRWGHCRTPYAHRESGQIPRCPCTNAKMFAEWSATVPPSGALRSGVFFESLPGESSLLQAECSACSSSISENVPTSLFLSQQGKMNNALSTKEGGNIWISTLYSRPFTARLSMPFRCWRVIKAALPDIKLQAVQMVHMGPTATPVPRLLGDQQHQGIIVTDIVWSGCGTYSYCHPMRVLCHIGELKVLALVDTGSDFDAIDFDLARLQENQGNPAFMSKTTSEAMPVKGFKEGMSTSTSSESRWMVTLTGAEVLHGRTVLKDHEVKFNEFVDLGDPMIFGCPTFDELGGIATFGTSHIWMVGLWVPRWSRGKVSGLLQVNSICSCEAQTSSNLRSYGPHAAQTDIVVDDKAWYPIETFWDGSRFGDLTATNQPWWLEASNDCPRNLEVLNTVVSPVAQTGTLSMTVLVRARSEHAVPITNASSICQLRAVDEECFQAVADFEKAYHTREVEDPEDASETDAGHSNLVVDASSSDPSVSRAPVNAVDEVRRRIFTGPTPSRSVSTSTGPQVTSISAGQISLSKNSYKARDRTDQQAKLFPQLLEEIEGRRNRLHDTVRDQNSEVYKDEICAKAKQLKLCPEEHLKLLNDKILRPFSDRFWDEGCAAPSIKGFKATITMKKDAKPPFRQPYRLSKFDEARLTYLYEEAEKEGKVERFELGQKPPCICTPVFIVDKKGSLIGRKVGDFRSLNENTEDYFYPAPEADTCLMEACGKCYHSLFDCVWGFEQIDVDGPTAELLSTITPFGTFKSKKLPMGVKQGPGIYQHMQDNALGNEYKGNGEKLCSVFFDDTHMGDHTVEEHVETVVRVLTVARMYNIQYRLSKCSFFQPEVLLLGFYCSKKGRSPDPKKVEQLRKWPEYRHCADIVSHIAFCNYLREFFGPDYPEQIVPLKKYLKKGADFGMFADDKEAQRARAWLCECALDKCVLVNPDWGAAAKPWMSGRPFEVYIDASDMAWCVVLTQRPTPGGTPQIIAIISRGFSDEATRWSAFEREYFAFKEGYEAIRKYADGFTLFMFFDHKNIERAESVLASRRASKKLVNWIADTQHILGTVVRVWIDGKNNVLADVGSRLSWEHAVAQFLPVPARPIREMIRLFFTSPTELAAEVEIRRKEMDQGPWVAPQMIPPPPRVSADVVPQPRDYDEAPGVSPTKPVATADVPVPESDGASVRSRSERRARRNEASDSLSGRSWSELLAKGSEESDGLSERSRSDRRARSNADIVPSACEPAEEFFIGDRDDDSQRSRSERRFLSDRRPDRIPVPTSPITPDSASFFDDPMHDFTGEMSEDPEDTLPGGRRRTNDRPHPYRIGATLGCDCCSFRSPISTEADALVNRVCSASKWKQNERVRAARVMKHSITGSAYVGTDFKCLFLEVCPGEAVLTPVMVTAGMPAAPPADGRSKYNLQSSSSCAALKRMITDCRPLLTHFTLDSWVCDEAEYLRQLSDPQARSDGLRAVSNMLSVAEHVASLHLFVCVECSYHRQIGWNVLHNRHKQYLRLHNREGFYFLDVHMCMYGYRLPFADGLTKMKTRFLTNAPWMVQLGMLCNGDHVHERRNILPQPAGVVPEFAIAYGDVLRGAELWVSVAPRTRPVNRDTPRIHCVHSLYTTGHWPNLPLTYTAGDLDVARRTCVATCDEDAPMIAPMNFDPARDPAKMAEYEEEFSWLIQWIRELKVPAWRIHYTERKSLEKEYVVDFTEEIFDIRTISMKKSLTFTAYGKHGVLKLGHAKALALAYTAFIASRIETLENYRFGCGYLKPNGFHGNGCGEFWVYPISEFLRRAAQPDFDMNSETCADKDTFCWNCRVVEETPTYVHCKCLGHAVGEAGLHNPRDMQYADTTYGSVRVNSDSIFMQIKQKVSDFVGPAMNDEGIILRCGQVGEEYYEELVQHQALLQWVHSFYWAHSKEPMTGFSICSRCISFRLHAKCAVVWWQPRSAAAVAIQPDGGEYASPVRYLNWLEPGTYNLREISDGVIFAHESCDQCAEYRDALELAGFPIPASLRVTGFDKSLTSVGIERGRLPHMYRVGSDTSAVMLLLLHGASRLSLDGHGAHILPGWVGDDQRAALLHDLCLAAGAARARVPLSKADISLFAPRFSLPLLGGTCSARAPFQRLQTPIAGSGLEWKDVSYRLTLCWKEETEETPLDPEHQAVINTELCVDRFEVAGVSLCGSPHATISTACSFSVTLFFGEPEPNTTSRDSRPDADFINVNGNELKQQLPDSGSGYGTKFSESDLNELGRRSGISLPKLKEAWGMIGFYRLAGGLLQRSIYSRTLGAYEFLTVVPEGDWRTVQHGGEKRRMTLRRYVITIFHCTPLGPHRDRDRTVQAIQDAGLWWQKMHTDVGSYVRHCLVCASAKARPIVTGHQRSRDYDGPFRYLIIDFVGPMSPPSKNNHVYMFTCACAWSGWYWAIPCVGNDSQTAAHCLFYHVMCDLAGYPACLGSDRDKAFVEGVVQHLVNFFGIVHVIGTAYHPQSQSPVERPHREYNALCKTFMTDFSEWEVMVYIFVWVIRTTCKLFNGSYTPYEVITGMKPRSPIDCLLASPSGLERTSVDKYVSDLVTYLKKVHQYVDAKHEQVREQSQRAKYRELGPGGALSVGDYCFVKKAPVEGISRRFQSHTFDNVFQVVEALGSGTDAKAYILSDLSGSRENLGFTQPVALDRLIPVELLPMAAPDSDQNTRILIHDGGQSRAATIVAQTMDGRVYIKYDDSETEICISLSSLNYQWL